MSIFEKAEKEAIYEKYFPKPDTLPSAQIGPSSGMAPFPTESTDMLIKSIVESREL